jgi:hypothetical protein
LTAEAQSAQRKEKAKKEQKKKRKYSKGKQLFLNILILSFSVSSVPLR